MKNFIKPTVLSFFIIVFLASCASKTFNEQMDEKAKKNIDSAVYEKIKDSYSQSIITQIEPKKTFVSILEDKSLSGVLKELEIIDGNYYFLKTNDFLIPKSRIKIDSLKQLNEYLSIVIGKVFVIEKTDSMVVVNLVDKSESKKIFFSKIPFLLEGDVTIKELSKLITSSSGFEISTDRYIDELKDFKETMISIKAENLLDAIDTLASKKDFYVFIDYNEKKIELSKYKDVVIELNIPMLNLKTSNTTSSQELLGENKVENQSSLYLFDELNKILTNILKNDTTSSFHIDKSSGLIYLKSTKSIEEAVRNLTKAYEESFSKEAIIEFERIELILHKNQKYGIASISGTGTRSDGVATTGSIESYNDAPNININEGFSFSKLASLTAVANNQIGYLLNYSKNLIVLKNNIPTVQSLSQNTDYISQLNKTVSENNNISTSAVINTIKDGTSITAVAKISRDKIFLNIAPSIKKFIKFNNASFENSTIQLPEYKDQSYNISKEINLGESVVVGSIIVHDDAKDYDGIVPIESFAIGGVDSKSYVRREIVYAVTLKSLKGF